MITIIDLLFIGFIIILSEVWILSIIAKKKIDKKFEEEKRLEDYRNGV